MLFIIFKYHFLVKLQIEKRQKSKNKGKKWAQ